MLDWTAAQVADRAFDVAFTALLIENPPLGAPSVVQPVIRTAARALSRRFTRAYNQLADAPVDDAQLRWHTQLHSVRILVDFAHWRAAGTIDQHRGHPWLSMEPALRAKFRTKYPATINGL